MHITVCICTRDRGDAIETPLHSILNANYSDFDVVVVDQSTSDETAQVVRRVAGDDPRVTYLRSDTTGSGVAHNIAVAHARGPIVSFTDDDCEVSPDRMCLFDAYFRAHPDVGLIFGVVYAGPHDPDRGFVPDYPVPMFRRVASPWLKWRERGIGANMAFRKEVLQAVGPFDEVLGPGAPLYACLDGDMTYRVLKAGYVVLNVPDAYVIHYGFRSWEQGQKMMRHVGVGVGAAYMKHLRLGDPAVVPTLVVEAWRCVAWRRLLLLRWRHVGVARLFGYLRGLGASFQYGIDRRWSTYLRLEATHAPAMHVTVGICTRDRGESIVTALCSVLASDYTNFDIVVVDQSDGDETARAVERVAPGNSRVRYIRSDTIGVAAARNRAEQEAAGPLLAFTDDDCEVASDWLGRLVAHFRHNPDVAEVYGAVYAGPHDPSQGFVPDYPIAKLRRISSPWLKWRDGGIGANMAYRLDVLRQAGPFDEALGPGGPLYSNEEGDMAYRILKTGYAVLDVPDARVIHHGFRTWAQGQTLMRKTGIGVAAAYMKHLRLGDPAVVPTLVVEWLRCIAWARLLQLRRYSGLRRFVAYGQGLAISFRYAVDSTRRTYVLTAGRSSADHGARQYKRW